MISYTSMYMYVTLKLHVLTNVSFENFSKVRLENKGAQMFLNV